MKKYRVDFSREADKDLKNLSHKIQQRIIDKISFWVVQSDPLSYGKKLRNKDNRYRFRISNYRIIASLKKDGTFAILFILRIGHRKDIYKKI